jgi:uncharacterized protein
MRLTVRVHPRSAKPRIEWDGTVAEVWIAAPPVEGRANAAVIDALSKWLDVSASSIRIVSGHRSRLKLIEVDGIEAPPP